jgi:GT2 family glycosyltransferase
MSSIDLSFVIIEYHCLDCVIACLKSIRNACAEISYEVIVSSNSMYNQREQEILAKKIPQVKWVFNNNNKGFAGGMNGGILMSSGKVIVLTNPDVNLSKCDIRKAYDYLMLNKNIGLIGPKILDNQGNIQDSCRKFMDLKEFFRRVYKRVSFGQDVLLNSMFDYTATQPVDWVIGAFMMVKREALAKVGLLDHNYFLYVEDMDWCNRFWKSGFQTVYFPQIEVNYKGDRKSTSALLKKKMFNKYGYYHLKSYLRFLVKNRFRVSRIQNYPVTGNNFIASMKVTEPINNYEHEINEYAIQPGCSNTNQYHASELINISEIS